MAVSTQVAVATKGGSTLDHSTYIGIERELTVDTSKNTVVVHNNFTSGGFPLAHEVGCNTIRFKAADGIDADDVVTVSQLNSSSSGSSGTASSWTAPITLSLTGDASGSVSFDGSSDVSMVVTVAAGSALGTSLNVPDSLVKRDASGNFDVGTITATCIIGEARTASKWATPRTFTVDGVVSGTVTVDGSSNMILSTNFTGGTVSTSNTANTLVCRDVNGDFAANDITANLITANCFCGTSQFAVNAGYAQQLQTPRVISLIGDVTGSATFSGGTDVAINTIVNVSGLNATCNATASTLMCRDTNGAVAAITMTADCFYGVATISDKLATPRTITLTGDVTGAVDFDGTSNVSLTTSLTTAATDLAVNSSIVCRDVNGDFAANIISAVTFNGGCFTGTATKSNTAIKLDSARNITLAGAVTGSVSFDGSGDVIINTSTTSTAITTATSAATPSTLMCRDVNGGVSATCFWGVATSADTATTATTADTATTAICADRWSSFINLSLTGDATGSVNISGSGDVILDVTNVNTTGFSSATPNTLVKRDANADFAANTICANCFLGQAFTATKLATPRTITLMGDASGSVSFDGSSDTNLPVTIDPTLIPSIKKVNVIGTLWTINHNLNQYTDIDTFTSGGVCIMGDVVKVSLNTTTVTFIDSVSGYATYSTQKII